jgi:2,5-diamino-6-(ribosylamino)-4(3H)-pyrimidinone 5'-phosphate reductase
MNRPITELFLLMSLDGKISTGDSDKWDVDKDIPKLEGNPSAGLSQYYAEEQETALWSLNSGRVMEKIGANSRTNSPKNKIPVSFVFIDNTHMNANAVIYYSKWAKQVVFVTSNDKHPAIQLQKQYQNITILKYSGRLNPKWMMQTLYKMGCKEITIQTGGTLNEMFLRHHLIDKVNIIMWPGLVGGKETSTLIDGHGIRSLDDIGILKLTACKPLKNSYIQLKYDVVNADKK